MRTGSVLSVFLTVTVSLAHANGRPPLTNGVHFAPNDDHSIYAATTFGLLISHDDGCSFRWVCEQSIGYGGQFDPKYAIATDGTIFATTFTGLRVSRDGGCTFATATASAPMGDPGRIADIWIDAIDIAPSGAVWVATAESGKPNNVYRSTDNGVTFAPRGMLSPTIWWKSLRVAPANAQRVYVTGYQVAGGLPDGGQMPPTAHFVRSSDEGEHWTESALAGVMYGPTPIVYAVAVDKANPDIVFMTSAGANPPAGDRLYRSTDGGDTFTEVLATTDPIRDTVVEADGKVLVATLAGGSFASTDHGATFSAMNAPPQLACLGQRSDGAVFGCGANWTPDFMAVAKTTDEQTWSKVFRFVELAGPLECGATTPEATMCAPLWPALQEQFGATGPTGPACSAPPVDVPTPAKPSSGGCCDASGTGGAAGMFALGLGAAVLVLRRRK